MFEQYLQNQVIQKKKWVKLILNGQPTNTFIHIYHKLNSKELLKAIYHKWGFKVQKIRLFSVQGVQYEINDLQYLKDKQTLYVSKGEDYASNQNFGQYQIIKVIGEGGFGKVSLAKNINTQQMVAIKVLKPNRMNSALDIDMIFRESQNMKALKHPNIVKIHNCYTLKQMQMVVVMEYMEGGQLLGLLKKKKKFQQDQAKHYFRQLISAISYCHQRNIVHRDLKLQNILITQTLSNKQNQGKNKHESSFLEQKTTIFEDQYPSIKVSDFGISGIANTLNQEIDTGTLKYMAPQALSKKQKINTSAIDIWSCGVILFYMVSGKLPFQGSKQSQIVNKIIKGKYSIPEQISMGCKQMIKKMLKTDPKKRAKIWQIETDPWLSKNEYNITQNQNLFEMGTDEVIEINEGNDEVLQLKNSIQPILCKSKSSVDYKKVNKKNHLISENIRIKKCQNKISKNYQQNSFSKTEDLDKFDSPNQLRRSNKSDTFNLLPSFHIKSTGSPSKNIRIKIQPSNFLKNHLYSSFKSSCSSSFGIPKRLQQEKNQIIQELQSYHALQIHKKMNKSLSKLQPQLGQIISSPEQKKKIHIQQRESDLESQKQKNSYNEKKKIQPKLEAVRNLRLNKKESLKNQK